MWAWWVDYGVHTWQDMVFTVGYVGHLGQPQRYRVAWSLASTYASYLPISLCGGFLDILKKQMGALSDTKRKHSQKRAMQQKSKVMTSYRPAVFPCLHTRSTPEASHLSLLVVFHLSLSLSNSANLGELLPSGCARAPPNPCPTRVKDEEFAGIWDEEFAAVLAR